MNRRAIAILVLAAGCEPPCEPYWKLRCDTCGADSPACEHAKRAAKNELSDEASCTKMVGLAESESSFAKERYCALHVATERSLDDLRGPWRCGDKGVDFSGPARESNQSATPRQIVVDGKATKIWNVLHASFQIEGAPACNYWLLPHEASNGEPALAISCPQPVGGLPDHMLRCVR